MKENNHKNISEREYWQGIGNIDDSFISASSESEMCRYFSERKKKRQTFVKKVSAVAACLVIVFSLFPILLHLFGGNSQKPMPAPEPGTELNSDKAEDKSESSASEICLPDKPFETRAADEKPDPAQTETVPEETADCEPWGGLSVMELSPVRSGNPVLAPVEFLLKYSADVEYGPDMILAVEFSVRGGDSITFRRELKSGTVTEYFELDAGMFSGDATVDMSVLLIPKDSHDESGASGDPVVKIIKNVSFAFTNDKTNINFRGIG